MKKQLYFSIFLFILLVVFTANCQQLQLPPSLQPLIYYRFDEGGGTIATDATENGLHGTLVGSATWNSEGCLGGALSLPGTQGYVRLPNNIIKDMKDMTIALWVKLASNSPWNRVFDFAGTKGFMYLTLNAGNPSGHIRFSIYAGNPQTEPVLVHPSASVALNTWTHIAVTVSPTEYCLYINGQKVAALPTTHFPMDIGADELNANYLGKSQFPDPYFNGLIDEFCLFNRALSDEEIITLYEYFKPR